MHSKSVKPKLLWLQGVTCNGNTHSFLNYIHLPQLLERFELLYHPILKATHTLETIVTCKEQCDILIFEGAYDPLMQRADVTLKTLLAHYAAHAQHIIAAGSCASFGGIFSHVAPQRSSGLGFHQNNTSGPLKNDTRLINLPGCPLHPEWLAYVLQMLLSHQKIPLDAQRRPKELFAYLVHHGCNRNEYFEWKVDAKSFGLKEGCLFYEQGCRGPMTHGVCNKVLWNESSSKTRAGTPCFGCTESDFPRSGMFETKTNMSIPHEVPLGVGKRAYLTLTGIAKTFHIERLEKRLIDDE